MKEATTETLEAMTTTEAHRHRGGHDTATSATSETTGKGGDRGDREGTKKAEEETTETLATMTVAVIRLPCAKARDTLELYRVVKAKKVPKREADVDEKGRNDLCTIRQVFPSKSRGVYSKMLYVGHHASNAGTDPAGGYRHAHWDAYTSRAMHEDPQH